MEERTIRIDDGIPPWDTVGDIAGAIDASEWVLVGGLMVQVHAMLAGRISRSTRDVDMLINLMATQVSASVLVQKLEGLGFSAQEPGLRGSAFHRMASGDRVVDVLVADHLPSRKRAQARVGRWPMLEAPGGAQALSRSIPVSVLYGERRYEIAVPDLLGAIVLKAAAYQADRRDRDRHLQDIALLCSLVEDVKGMRLRLRGSDGKRLRRANEALADPNDTAWLVLDPRDRVHGQDVLRILSQ